MYNLHNFVGSLKKRTLISVLYLFLGVILGAIFVFVFVKNDKPSKIEYVEKEVVKIREKTDTVRVEVNKVIYKKPEIITQVIDSIIPLNDADSLGSDEILREIMLSKRIIELHQVIDTSSAAFLLNVERNSFKDQITIEYWKSPLALTGYELSRNKLKLFGFDPEQDLLLSVEDNKTLLAEIDSIQLKLKKSQKFEVIHL